MNAFTSLVEKSVAHAREGYVAKTSAENAALQGVWRLQNVDITIPPNPAGANLGTASEGKKVWVAQTAPVPLPPGLNQLPQTTPQAAPSGDSTFGTPGVWVYSPAPIAVVDDKGEAPKADVITEGDLVSFKGPGGASFEAQVVMVTRDHAVARIAGQVIALPSSSLAPFNPDAGAPQTDVVRKSADVSNTLVDLRSGVEQLVKRALGDVATDDDSANPAPGYNDGTPAGGAPVVDGPPYVPSTSEPGTPVNGYLSEAEIMLVNSALDAYSRSGMTIDDEGPAADDVAEIDKALKTAAFNRPGIASRVATIRAKLQG